jgi:hypothetical protein
VNLYEVFTAVGSSSAVGCQTGRGRFYAPTSVQQDGSLNVGMPW